MKSYNNLFEQMLDDEKIKQCFLDAAKKKKDRKDVAEILKNIDQEVINLKTIITTESFEPTTHRPCTINENTNEKTREIIKPDYRYEQVVHHCVIGQLSPIIMHGLYKFSCGSIPGRGPHYGKKYMEKWINSYKGKFYVFKMDVHHFFESVDHEILKEMLKKVIRDKKFLSLVFKIIDAVKVGLPLGYYTSQWFANFFLKKLDHLIKQEFKAEHYMRYMDDMVILGKNKKQLHKIKNKIETYLQEKLNLQIKGDWQVFRFEYIDKKTGKKKGRFLDFMGFKFHGQRTTIRKTIISKAVRKARKIEKKERPTWYDATQMMSYMGWFKHTDTYGYFDKHIKSRVEIRTLKRLISRHQRKENEKNDRLEKNRNRPGGRTPGNRRHPKPDHRIRTQKHYPNPAATR